MRTYAITAGCEPCASGVIGDPFCAPLSSTVRTDCRCDDVNGDLTEIVGYVTASIVTVSRTGEVDSRVIGDFVDASLAAPYVPVSPVDCCDIGEPAPFVNTYAESQPVCALVDGAGPVPLLQLTVRDRTTHVRVATLYEDPGSGGRVDPGLVVLVDASRCSECCEMGV